MSFVTPIPPNNITNTNSAINTGLTDLFLILNSNVLFLGHESIQLWQLIHSADLISLSSDTLMLTGQFCYINHN